MELEEEIRRLREEIASATSARTHDRRHSRTARVNADLGSLGKFLYQLTAALIWIKRNVLRYLWGAFKCVAAWTFHQYRRLWAYSVYRRDKTDGELVYSRTRATALLVGTFLFTWYLLLPIVGAIYDGALYALTSHVDEQIYLLGSQEIDSNTGAHIIEGCSALPCSDRDAIYFRTEDSLFNNLWSFAHGHGFFYPEYVGAAVPYAISKCAITSYGIRRRFPFRIVNMYSYILAVTCHPVTQTKEG